MNELDGDGRNKYKKCPSLGSERELDNLNDINSLTSLDFRNMSSPGDNNETYTSRREDQYPRHPGTELPPHHSNHREQSKKRKQGKSLSWNIELKSDIRKSPDSDRWDRDVDPLPEPQMDIPVFSVGSEGQLPGHSSKLVFGTTNNHVEADPYTQEFIAPDISQKVKKSVKHKKRKKHNSQHQSLNDKGVPKHHDNQAFVEESVPHSFHQNGQVLGQSSLAHSNKTDEGDTNIDHTFPSPAPGTSTLYSSPVYSPTHIHDDEVILNIRNRKGSSTSAQTDTIGESHEFEADVEDTFQSHLVRRPTSRVGCKRKDTSKLINQGYTSRFISDNILQRECNRFAWNRKPNSSTCVCGREPDWHEEREILTVKGEDKTKDSNATVWHQKTHTSLEACDSFGEIYFRGFGSSTTNSPYVRVDDQTDPDLVWELLIECWKMPKPRLLISVTGGAQRFELKPRLSSILKQGLVGAAVNTGAWIITGGTATGVMEFVGEAVRDHMTMSGRGKDESCVALGIATWGCVANKLALDGEGEKGLWPATYAIEDVMSPPRGSAALDCNHTHFLLIDNGTEGIYGAEIKFRSQLESHISKVGTTGVSESQVISVPVVLIVVEGGVGTMETVYQSLRRNTPVVVISGSGRAADYIALGFNLSRDPLNEDKSKLPPDFNETMREAAEIMFLWKDHDTGKDKKIENCVDALRHCMLKRSLINVFDLEKSQSVKDIDRAILYALLRANKSNCKSQLALALAWNRCDIARQQIFTRENRPKWEIRDLYDAMFTAIVQDRADFVQLFLDNGVDLKKFLTSRTLWNIYCNCLGDESDGEASILRQLVTYFQQGWGSYLLCKTLEEWKDFPKFNVLHLINKIIIHLLQDESFIFYPQRAPYVMNCDERQTMEWKGDMGTIQPLLTRISSRDQTKGLLRVGQSTSRRCRFKQKVKETYDFEHPEKDLFIFAVLFNRRKMAELFLHLGTEQIATALFGCSLLKALSDRADMDEEVRISMDFSAHSRSLESFAICVLTECYSRSKLDAHLILTREIKKFGNITLLTLAERQGLMDFGEHSACQTKLTDIWKGSLTMHTSDFKILITIFFPLLIFLIKFKKNALADSSENGDADVEMVVTDQSLEPVQESATTPRFTRSKTRRVDDTKRTKYSEVKMFDCRSENAIGIIRAYHKFYKAPVTKFYTNIMAYLVFLALFSFFLLTNLKPVTEPDSPSIIEIMVWVWFATSIMEEFRQVMIGDQRSIQYKIRNWWSNFWNQFDFIMYLGVITSIIMRYNLPASTFVWVRIVYSITLSMCYLRFMQYFFAEKNMGPKVIMIRRMLTDLMFFFLILLVFILSFGVAYHVNMFPNAPVSWSIFFNVLYYPYFQMYGELFLENLKGDEVDDCTRNETIWREDPFRRCGEKNAIIPILLATYMVLTNILLVNLLIAMFSYTFQMVQENSTKVWRFYRIALVYEYFDRPTLVPPIIIIDHIWRIIRYFLYQRGRGNKRKHAFRQRLSDEDNVRLSLLEKAAMDVHLAFSSLKAREQLDQRVASTSERLETVVVDLQQIKEAVQLQEVFRTTTAVNPNSRPVTPSAKVNAMSRHDSQLSSTAWGTPREDVTTMQSQLQVVQNQIIQNSHQLNQVMTFLEQMVSSQGKDKPEIQE